MTTSIPPESEDEILYKVTEILSKELEVDSEDVTPEARLLTDLGADSIDILSIRFRLEKVFGIKTEEFELFPVTEPPEGFDSIDAQYGAEGRAKDIPVHHIVSFVKAKLEGLKV